MFAGVLAATLVWSIDPGRPVAPPALAPVEDKSEGNASVQLPGPTLPPSNARPIEGPTSWYGGPAIAVDVVSLALMGGGGAANSPELVLLGAAGFAFGGPINHLTHVHP